MAGVVASMLEDRSGVFSVLRLGNPGRRSRDCHEQREMWTRVGLGASMWLSGIGFCKVQGLSVRPQSLVALCCCLNSAALASNLLVPELTPSPSKKLELSCLLVLQSNLGPLSSVCIGEWRVRQLDR